MHDDLIKLRPFCQKTIFTGHHTRQCSQCVLCARCSDTGCQPGVVHARRSISVSTHHVSLLRLSAAHVCSLHCKYVHSRLFTWTHTLYSVDWGAWLINRTLFQNENGVNGSINCDIIKNNIRRRRRRTSHMARCITFAVARIRVILGDTSRNLAKWGFGLNTTSDGCSRFARPWPGCSHTIR